MRHAGGAAAVDVQLLEVRDLLEEAVAQGLDAHVFGGHFLLGNGEGFAHADDLVGWQGARTHAALMATAVDDRFQAHTRLAADVQRADAFGAIDLVRRERHQVDLQLLQVDFDLAGRLRGIDVEQHAARAGQFTDGGDVVDRADFVVHVHQRDQDGVVAQRRLDLGRGDDAVFAWLEVGDFETFTLELASGIQDRLVLDLGGDDVLALGLIEVRNAFQGEVVGLGGTAGPDDLARVGVDQLGHLATAVLDRFFGLPAEHVGTRGRVTEVSIDQQAVGHLLGDAGIDRGGRGVIEVDRQLH